MPRTSEFHGTSHVEAFCATGSSPGTDARRRQAALRGTAPVPPSHPGRRNAGPHGVPFEVVGAASLPAVFVLGGISADRHVTSNRLDPSPGWWEAQVGPGRALDPSRLRILGIDYLGHPSTGEWPAQSTDGTPIEIRPADQAEALAAVLDHLEIRRVAAVIGASYGGTVALAFARLHPDRLHRLIVCAAGHRPHPMATCIRSIQRRIVELGAAGGNLSGALALARELAFTTYRTASEFERRFGSEGAAQTALAYLQARGQDFAERFSVDAFLHLSKSLDLADESPEAITAPTSVISFLEDSLVPTWLVDELVSRLGGPVRDIRLSSERGHDAFLTETLDVGEALATALGDLR